MEEQRPGSGETMRRVGLGAGLAIGMGVGVALGAGLNNMGTGIALGLVIGAAVMVAFTAAGTRMQRDEQRRRAEAEGGTDAGPVDARDADASGRDLPGDQPDQPSSGSSGAGA
ncbi:hypothetical protein [Microbacterium sp. MYb64]|uniref:hypothetical protein n=1 Tax=Microbacterium sp. MYb64 TaxID=1848691 RepID=UPI000CFABA48|nr:hypothetical protein [Microbacterium sp. MYb64]PRB03662.1 hypothetical protein CQ044_12895 [Microbacterium sp. MYb64]